VQKPDYLADLDHVVIVRAVRRRARVLGP